VLLRTQMAPGFNPESMNTSPQDDFSGAQIPLPGLNDEPEVQARSAVLLARAFSDFIAASSRLEISYRELQEEVSELRQELSARNAALSTSLAENDRMRLDLQQILDSMPCGVLVLDHKGEISMINPESGRLLGLDGVQFPDSSQATLQQVSAMSGVKLETSADSFPGSGQEFCIQGVNGKRWLEVRNRPLFQSSDQPDRTILILRDVTAQKRAEEERESARKAMALAEITMVLAHEIRNPLASLELFAEMIENDAERREQWISNLRAGIRTLSGTVNNVLTFHGSGSLQLSPVSLSSVISNAIQFIRPLAQQACVSLVWRHHRQQDFVMGNESALQQVVLNLVSNAIRHTPPGGTVKVSEAEFNQSGPRIVVEFSDTGSGIRPEQIDRIFEAGFSGNGDTAGLGLAVCDRIIKQHRGEIGVSRQTHPGARFFVSLPLLPPHGDPA